MTTRKTGGRRRSGRTTSPCCPTSVPQLAAATKSSRTASSLTAGWRASTHSEDLSMDELNTPTGNQTLWTLIDGWSWLNKKSYHPSVLFCFVLLSLYVLNINVIFQKLFVLICCFFFTSHSCKKREGFATCYGFKCQRCPLLAVRQNYSQ